MLFNRTGVHSRFHNIVIANEISAWVDEGVVNSQMTGVGTVLKAL